jgi:hypothetical protein
MIPVAGRERAVVLQRVGVVGQFLRLADVMPEDVFRRRNSGDLGQVIHQRADEFRPGGPLLHAAGEVFVVDRNPFICSLLRDNGRAGRHEQGGHQDEKA